MVSVRSQSAFMESPIKFAHLNILRSFHFKNGIVRLPIKLKFHRKMWLGFTQPKKPLQTKSGRSGALFTPSRAHCALVLHQPSTVAEKETTWPTRRKCKRRERNSRQDIASRLQHTKIKLMTTWCFNNTNIVHVYPFGLDAVLSVLAAWWMWMWYWAIG